MAKTLGLFVSSDRHLDKIIKTCRAARGKDIEVTIFFTHEGTLLTQDPRFGELESLANMAVCRVGFERNQLKPPVIGIDAKDYASQARHGEMIETYDRYLVF